MKGGLKLELKLIEKRQETKDVFSFIFEISKPVSWHAGQYALYKIPHTNPDNRGDTRIFTISSPPYQKKVMLTTRYFFQESSSFKKALFSKKIGEIVNVLRIQGHFIIENPENKLVFIAGGIGITPFNSILLELEKAKQIKDIILVYSNKNEENVIFKETLSQLAKANQGLAVRYIYSPQRCDREYVQKTISDFQERIFYISGPLRLVKSVEESLSQLNINREKIRKDYFPVTGEY